MVQVTALKPKFVIVHYSESDTGTALSFEKFHKETRGWSRLGYNYVIPRNGSIENIIGELTVGIHAGMGTYNKVSIGICVVCTKEKPPTKWQMRQLMWLIHTIISKYDIAIEDIIGHKETGRDTDCPGPIDMNKLRSAISDSRRKYKELILKIDSVIL